MSYWSERHGALAFQSLMKSKETGSGRGFGRVLFKILFFLYKKFTRPTSLRVEEENEEVEGEEAGEDNQGVRTAKSVDPKISYPNLVRIRDFRIYRSSLRSRSQDQAEKKIEEKNLFKNLLFIAL